MQNLINYSANNKIKTAILNIISLHILNNKQKKKIIENFNILDTNGDGQVSKEELENGKKSKNVKNNLFIKNKVMNSY